MIFLKSNDRLLAINEIKIVKRLVEDGQKNLVTRYFVVLVPATNNLPNCVLITFGSYEPACDYLAIIAEEITKRNENYVFYTGEYPTPLDDLVK